MTEQNPQALPKRMETIAAYIFQNENLLHEALIMYHKGKTHHYQYGGAARLSNSGAFSDVYISANGDLLPNSTSDLYKDWSSHCVYCGNNYANSIKNINCHLHVKLVDDPAKIWIDLYNHLIPIVEAYHNDGIPAAAPTRNPPKRRPSVATYIVQSGEKMQAATDWWVNQPDSNQLVGEKEYEHVNRILDAALKNLKKVVTELSWLSNDSICMYCTYETMPEWIEVYNALLNIAEHYHAFTNEQNAAPMDTPTTEKELPNAEAVEASESKTTTTYICGRCDTEHTSMTSAAMCCPDVDVMHTCNECGLHYDYRAEADYCCSSVKTEYHHPRDYDTMLYACRTCGTIPFGKLEGGEQRTAADQHCNPMDEK